MDASMIAPRPLRWAAALGLAALILAAGVNPLTNNDIWIHLTTGRLILEEGAVPRADPYSFTFPAAPYTAHEWLAQILFWCVHRVGGITGLILLKPAALAATAALTWMTCRTLGAGPVASFWGAILTVASLSSHLFVRPHLFSFVMLAADALLLARRARGQRGAVWPLLALQILWANLHGGFVLGIALALLAGAWRAGAAMALVSLLNPRGADLYRFVLLFADPVFRERIREWGSPFAAPFSGSMHFWIYAAVLAGCAAGILHHARRRRWGAAATLVAFAVLSAASKRNVSLLGVAAAPWLALAATEARDPRRAGGAPASRSAVRGLGLSAAAAIGLAAAAFAFGVPHETGRPRRPGLGLGDNVPVAAVDYLQRRGIEGNALNSMGFGGYLIWRAWPASRVFIDSRLDVYGGDFVERHVRSMTDPTAMAVTLRRHPIDYALISWRLEEAAGAVGALSGDPGWALVYFDDAAMVYLPRRPRWADPIAGDEYRVLNPHRFLSGEISFGGDPGRALVEADRALAAAPGGMVARLMKGTALQALGRHGEAVAVLEEAKTRLDPDAGGRDLLLGLLGTSYMELGDREKAARAFRDLLEVSPGSTFARRMLEEIETGKGARP